MKKRLIKMDITKFPSVENFHTMRKSVVRSAHVRNNLPVTYRGKIKLHGTNGGIVCHKNGNVIPLKRSGPCSVTNDNYGFARWVATQEKAWSVFGKIMGGVTVYGEWAGPGIQSGVAISHISRPIFAIFALMVEVESEENESQQMIIMCPKEIKRLMDSNPLFPVSDTYILPYMTDPITINFNSPESMNKAIDTWNKLVDDCEECDPWVKESFNVEGVGEGYVFYPFSDQKMIPREVFSKFMIKAKGAKHSVVAQRAPVQFDPVVATNVDQFVENCVTENRMKQGWTELGCNDIDNPISQIGAFIGWVSKDTAKECITELEAAGLEWKQVSKAVGTAARVWFLDKINRVE